MVDTVSGLGAELLSPGRVGHGHRHRRSPEMPGRNPGLSLMTISPAAWEALEARKPEPLRPASSPSSTGRAPGWRASDSPTRRRSARCTAWNRCWTRHWRSAWSGSSTCQQTIARACREGVKALGLELWPAREEIAAACVTAVRVPDGIDDAKLRGTMRHRYGVMISPGYGELLGQLFRLGHMGPAQAHPTILAAQLAVLERSLADLGYPVQLGAGVGAAMAACRGMGRRRVMGGA